MEADTDGMNATSPTIPGDATMLNKAVKTPKCVHLSPSNLTLPLPTSQSVCHTPSLDNIEHDLLKQQHVLRTYDSGFSDWTPDSSALSHSQSSLAETPSFLPDGGSISFQSTASSCVSESSTQCSLSQHHRRSWPMRSRKLSFQSPDSDADTRADSPVLRVQVAQEDNGCYSDSLCNTNNSNSPPSFHPEDEISRIFSKSNIAKHSPVGQFLERSRSLSRSPLSSVSDDLENSFQEMSLEENSSSSNSSSNQPSPTPVSCSSPVFSFGLQRETRDSLNLSNNGRKLSHLSWGSQLLPSQRDVDVQNSSSFKKESNTTAISQHSCQTSVLPINVTSLSSHTLSQSDISSPHVCSDVKLDLVLDTVCEDIHKVDFASSLSLVPVVEQSKSKHISHHSLSSTSSTPFHGPTPSLSTYRHNHESSDPSLLNSDSSASQCQCSNSHLCSTCHDAIPIPAQSDNFIKSPTKRISNIPGTNCHESVSPQKMLKLRFQEEPSSLASNIKRDLFNYQCAEKETANPNTTQETVIPYTQHRAIVRSADERTPQFFHLGGAAIQKSLAASSVQTHATPVSRWKSSSLSHRQGKSVNCKEKYKEAELIDRICLEFSPSVPSQLIGRHVGLKEFDILGELHQHNVMECVEIILAYVADSDLITIAEVSSDWKRVVFAESKACRRYRLQCKKLSSPRKVRHQAEKENVVDKPVDRENVQMTSSKGHLTTIQPQFVVKDSSTPLLPPQTLDLQSEDRTRNCPHCQCRAVVVPSQDRATCSSDKCAYDFCTKCFFPFHHPSPCKPLFHCASKTMLAGSKKSKRNLKRLKN